MAEDICRNRHGGNPQSEAANAHIDGHKPNLRERIYMSLVREGAATAEEISFRCALRMSTVAARMSELKRIGWIKATGEERRTTSGEFAAVLEANTEWKNAQ